MATLTARLVECIHALDFDHLPAQAVDTAKEVVLDGLGVIMAGYAEPSGLGRIVVEYVRGLGGEGQARVVGGGFSTSMPNAAFANGTLAHALDFDNTWYPLNHPTSPTLPAILALAEHLRLPGRSIVTALVAAFEVQGRLRLAATGLETGHGFHKPGMTGIFGAAAAAAKLLDLQPPQMTMALGIAGSRAGSMSLNTGTMTKSSHSGHAARMGLECALLAKLGFTAHEDIFGPGGFFDTFMPGNAEPERLVEGFGAPLRMVSPGVGFKKHPSNYFTHRPIDAALALRERHRIDWREIDRVVVRFPRFDYVDRPRPKSGLDGKFSVQYTTALALIDGAVGIDSFTDQRRFAPDVEALLARIQLMFDDDIPRDFDRMHVEVTVHMRTGEQYAERLQRLSGWCGNPLSREQRLRKFFDCSRHILDRDAAERVASEVDALETLTSIEAIMAAVGASARA